MICQICEENTSVLTRQIEVDVVGNIYTIHLCEDCDHLTNNEILGGIINKEGILHDYF